LLTLAASVGGFGSAAASDETTRNEQRRVHMPDLSFDVPREFVRCNVDAVDMWRVDWALGGVGTYYSAMPTQLWERQEEHGSDFCRLRGRNAGIKLSFSAVPPTVSLLVRRPSGDPSFDRLWVKGKSIDDACARAEALFASLASGPIQERLRVDYVSPDRSYAVLMDASGQVAAVRKGDLVAEFDGHVKEIAAHGVRITVLHPDGAGGYLEVPIEIGRDFSGREADEDVEESSLSE
jgi:hypothetical protein